MIWLYGERADRDLPPSGDWREDVARVIRAVRFDPDPAAEVDRLTELIVATDSLPGPPERYLTSARTALTGTARLAALVSQRHTEGALRKMLRDLAARLEEWTDVGSAAVQVPLDAWRPEGQPATVARLERDREHLARWLRVSFEQVADDLGDLHIAVMRLSSGQLVALTESTGNPIPGTTLLQPGERPPHEVIKEFLADTRLPRVAVAASP